MANLVAFVGLAFRQVIPARRWAWIFGCGLLAACVQQPPAPDPQWKAIDDRLRKLEDQVTTLERLLTNLPSPPMRSRAEIAANIHALELRRTELLSRYTPAHPDVREVDLSLRLLRLQLEFLDQSRRVQQ